MAQLQCLRCGTEMEFFGREKIQLGEESVHGGILAAMTAESMQLDIFQCPECGKVEFFKPLAKSRTAPPKTNWTCSGCGTYNLGRVQNCQCCGMTRAWSDQQARNE